MKKDYAIRPYADADWSALCRIHDAARRVELRQTVGEAAFLDLETTAESEGLFEGAVDVLEADGRVKGFVAYTPHQLTWLYVDPSEHGKGFGRALLRRAIAMAADDILTEVLDGNEAATALYAAEGFEIVERKTDKLVGNEAFAATGLILRRVRR